ncbi:hypothetical protein JANAI62_03700 [Jannaschia pagri]|uniref:Uncharacterized protein n=1 Tax=Jannaschia pagri TaxID=2829797 RepID=A0ABQ4NI34_9RHOB|nr:MULTISPECIES: hypothetical protein [unclassified Jannaschia]GIT90147.1 hypothetical protein JANAI61_06050 [Jannaschia sp. AI_61]GIT93747.1 hypothetical protein JANAI62_03700 [Jannaschia sp. AI_62]
MVKTVIKQADFSLMAVREDLLEADDIEARSRSLQDACNVRSLASRAIEARPGSMFIRDGTGYEYLGEIRPRDGLVYGLLLAADRLTVIQEDGATVYNNRSVPWTDLNGIWVQTFRQKTFIGHPSAGIIVLELTDGVWSLARITFDATPGDATAQPYWQFQPGVSITPSARTGNITVTSSAPVFDVTDALQVFRYGEQEFRITSVTSNTSVQATVLNTLPPSFRITVANAETFKIGQAVEGEQTKYQGVVQAISGNDLFVATVKFYDGPDNGENLSNPVGSSTVSSKVSIAPLPSTVWDEPLMSTKNGWARSGSAVGGRLILCDFPKVPDLIALSSVRSVTDFVTGSDEDDAILRQVGDDVPRFLHAINAGDLILLSDRGSYYVPTRGNGVISPSTFRAILFDKRASSLVRPTLVDAGVAFIDHTKRTVLYANLMGNVNLRWQVRDMTVFHPQVIDNPVALCGPGANFRTTEKYLLVVNGSGTMAAVSWRNDLDQETVGFVPWVTEGSYKIANPIFDQYLYLVDRDVDGTTQRFLERFDETLWVDSAVSGDATLTAPHLVGETVSLMRNDGYGGQAVLPVDGAWPGEAPDGDWQIGLFFDAFISPWVSRIQESSRRGMVQPRVIRLGVAVQKTGPFSVVLNGTRRQVGGYSFGDVLSNPPTLRTKIYRFPILGNRDYPDMKIERDTPGPFRVLALYQEVTG